MFLNQNFLNLTFFDPTLLGHWIKKNLDLSFFANTTTTLTTTTTTTLMGFDTIEINLVLILSWDEKGKV